MNVSKIVLGVTFISISFILSTSIIYAEDEWRKDSNVISGLTAPYTYPTPDCFLMGNENYLISGSINGDYTGFRYVGETWLTNNDIINGLGNVGTYSDPSIFFNNSTWYIIAGSGAGTFYGYNWTGTTWQSDSNIISGIGYIGSSTSPCVFENNSNLYLIAGNLTGFTGFNWTGTTWQSDSDIISGLSLPAGDLIPKPEVFTKDGSLYLISGSDNDTYVGFKWDGSTWQTDNISTGIDGVPYALGITVHNFLSEWIVICADHQSNYYGFSPDTGTSVSGYVYEGTTESSIALSEVIVSIYNNTWSNIVYTDLNGYYLITGLTNDTYAVGFKKDRYISVENQVITPLLNESFVKNVWLQKSTGEYYSRHYTTFTLKNIFGACYSNVDTVVYDNGAIEATSTTGTDGAVTFHLFEDVEYTITFINASQGVDESIVITPRDNAYIIYVTLLDFSLDDSATVWASVDYHWSKNRINNSHGWINFTYTDTTNSTWEVEYFVNRSVNNSHNEPAYYFISSQNGTWVANSSYTVSQIVLANNTTFVCHFSADNPNLPSLSGSGSAVINFVQGVMVDLGWEDTWKYNTVGIVLIIFIGLLFGAANAHIGAVVVVLTGWFLWYIKWLQPPEISFVALCLATCLAVLFVMRKGESLKA